MKLAQECYAARVFALGLWFDATQSTIKNGSVSPETYMKRDITVQMT